MTLGSWVAKDLASGSLSTISLNSCISTWDVDLELGGSNLGYPCSLAVLLDPLPWSNGPTLSFAASLPSLPFYHPWFWSKVGGPKIARAQKNVLWYRSTYCFLQCTNCICQYTNNEHIRGWMPLVPYVIPISKFITNSMNVQKIWNAWIRCHFHFFSHVKWK
jgi:hypothetical protein